ncbi:WhiB family transcriptional regulator [Nocardioides kribbensis]|uniref:Transcriptional regulator WhiB n=1 Tax=Nocardioides kribbensis TaxID=305517 RepID=A0ABV1NZ48_9ACTN
MITPDFNRAACTSIGPAIFFPEPYERMTEAKQVCAGCPIRVACLEYAIANREEHGVWGGRDFGRVRSERERVA